MNTPKKQIDLGNLAFMLKEVIQQLEQLDETEIETLEIMLDDELIKAIEESEANPEYLSYEEFFKDAISNKVRQKSNEAASKVA